MCDIRFAMPDDLTVIRTIWSAVFTEDTADVRDQFLKMVSFSEECVLACEDGKPVSMAFFLPAVLHTQNGDYTVRYLYAASTLPAYRGRGIFSDLLKAALQMLKSLGVEVCLLNPAEPSLVSFYQRFGFAPAFFCHTVKGCAEPGTLSIQPLSTDDYIALRETLLPREHVVWDSRLLRYVASYASAVRIGDGCALFTKDENTLRIIELLGVRNSVCGAMAQIMGCGEFTMRIPDKTGDCFGMLLRLDNHITLSNSLYMGLAFD